jgi:hypothetical protein
MEAWEGYFLHMITSICSSCADLNFLLFILVIKQVLHYDTKWIHNALWA